MSTSLRINEWINCFISGKKAFLYFFTEMNKNFFFPIVCLVLVGCGPSYRLLGENEVVIIFFPRQSQEITANIKNGGFKLVEVDSGYVIVSVHGLDAEKTYQLKNTAGSRICDVIRKPDLNKKTAPNGGVEDHPISGVIDCRDNPS
ncbi:MAG: hypothetical protein F6K62_10625 [Sphaerospermopsis sp. SIO1G2]|nr:hypothetical protein [Sphaerospermopsis sp. SIO1G2]